MTPEKLSSIISSIAKAKDPLDGSFFNQTLLSDQLVLDAINTLAIAAQKAYQDRQNIVEQWPEDEIYEELRQWRNNVARETGIQPYMVLWNDHLRNIVEARIDKKEDLLSVYGIGPCKYENYGDFEIILDYLDKRNVAFKYYCLMDAEYMEY